MRTKLAVTCALAALLASVTYAQPTPTRVPPKFTVATAPSCVDGEPRIYSVTDAASSASCTVGGGTTEVLCQCLDGARSVLTGGGGVSDGDKGDISVSGSGATWTIDNDAVALGTDTSGGYAASLTEGGAATTATALAANGANCSAGQFPLGVDASGAAESCSTSLSGNAATATALAANPTDCTGTDKATAIAASGNLTCGADIDTDDQAATEVPYTPTTGTNWTDPDPTHVGGGLDALAARLTTEEAKADDDVPESGDFGAAADLEADGSLSADVVAAAEMADADHGDVSWSGGVATVDSGAVGLTELADDGGCTGGQATRRNAGDTAFECYTPAAGGIGGSTGATDNAILRADGVGGATAQASPLTVADTNGLLTFPNQAGAGITFYNNAAAGSIRTDTGNFGVIVAASANSDFWFSSAAFRLAAGLPIGWTAGTSAVAGMDTGLARNAAGVLRSTNGSTGIRGFLGGGAAVASATALPVPTGRVFHVTGTTTVTSITSTNFGSGACVTLIFDDILTFTDGSNLKLAGDFVTTADDTISLCYDGTNWFETGRAIN